MPLLHDQLQHLHYYIPNTPRLSLNLHALERMTRLSTDANAGMVYADHYQVSGETKTNNPLLTTNSEVYVMTLTLVPYSYIKPMLSKAVSKMKVDYQFAGLYDLRLKLSQTETLVHINEYLYSGNRE